MATPYYDTIFYSHRTCCNEFQYPGCLATPFPGAHGSYGQQPGPYPRHHSRHASGDTYGYSPRAFSPRYNSSGYYATANPPRYEHRRRNSSSHQTSYRDSDENEEACEYKEYLVDGVIYRVLLPRPTKQNYSPHYGTPPSRRRRQSSSSTRAIPKTTEADARKHRIPPGYSLKNWDPSEQPTMLLGSVFDANNLGK
jgi:hypothetical protein